MESIHNFCFKQQYWYQLVWNTARSSLHISYSSWINILEGLPTSLMLLPWIQRLALCDSHFAEAAEIPLSESLPSDLWYIWSAIFSCFSLPRQLWTYQKDAFSCKNVWISSLIALPVSLTFVSFGSQKPGLDERRADQGSQAPQSASDRCGQVSAGSHRGRWLSFVAFSYSQG